MYDLIDRPIATLPVFDRRMLDRMRRWVHAFSIAGATGIDGADDPLTRAMHALDQGSVDDLVIQRPCFATVDETEAVILSLWRLVRDDRGENVRPLAAMLVDTSHAGALLDAMAETLATL